MSIFLLLLICGCAGGSTSTQDTMVLGKFRMDGQVLLPVGTLGPSRALAIEALAGATVSLSNLTTTCDQQGRFVLQNSDFILGKHLLTITKDRLILYFPFTIRNAVQSVVKLQYDPGSRYNIITESTLDFSDSTQIVLQSFIKRHVADSTSSILETITQSSRREVSSTKTKQEITSVVSADWQQLETEVATDSRLTGITFSGNYDILLDTLELSLRTEPKELATTE
jgi:hypothetical protein